MTESRVPSRGKIFLGIAVAAFATGPCLLMLIGAIELFESDTQPYQWQQRFRALPALIGFSSVICLIGSAPAACLNAFILNRAANNDMDRAWFAMFSGAGIGAVVEMILVGRYGSNESPVTMATFMTTGALMGLLHWFIAVRPRRRRRLRLMRDDEAIRAME